MTGYGQASGPVSGGCLQLEIRTVNHRHFSASLKLCSPLQSLEVDVRNRLRNGLERGHVTVTTRWIEEPERPSAIRVNLERAREVVDALDQLKGALNLPGEIDLGFVARQPDVFTGAAGPEPTVDVQAVLAVVDSAVNEVVAMREREGDTLRTEIESVLTELERELEKIDARAPQRIEAERDRLRRSVAELLNGRTLAEDRLSQEIALIADKLDITEEVVRLRAHISACRVALERKGQVGRRLTFLGQEMLREINTIGSKANDAEIAQAVIEMKGAVEKFREQIDNVE